MSAEAVTHPYDWSKESTEEGDEIYTLSWRVNTTSLTDGPDVAWTAAGLPYPGASLNVGGTTNPWAFFQGKGSAKLQKQDANRKLWNLTTVFSTKPIKRCSASRVDDPLLEPPNVKGSFSQVMEEALADKDGNPIQNTVKQRYTGSIVQTPKSRPVVELEMNVAWINLAWLAEYADTVNSNVQWGQAVRTIKCTVGPWERVLYGSCYYYFVVRFTFELKTDKWDLHLPNIASRERVLDSDPWEYKSYKLADEENSKGFVDATSGYATATANFLDFRVLKEKDFSIVGWPASLI
jgi:hypothetical protein